MGRHASRRRQPRTQANQETRVITAVLEAQRLGLNAVVRFQASFYPGKVAHFSPSRATCVVLFKTTSGKFRERVLHRVGSERALATAEHSVVFVLPAPRPLSEDESLASHLGVDVADLDKGAER